jgi:hypothetical protein
VSEAELRPEALIDSLFETAELQELAPLVVSLSNRGSKGERSDWLDLSHLATFNNRICCFCRWDRPSVRSFTSFRDGLLGGHHC